MTDITGGARQGVAEVYNTVRCGRITQAGGAVQQLSADTYQIFGVIVQNDSDSTDDVLVGNSLVQYFELVPGASVTIPIDHLTKVYVSFGAGTATVNWLAMS